MKNISGIYCIENIINNKKYIGSSNNIAYRLSRHLGQLKVGNHVNKHLQAAFNKYKINNFKFYILEECPNDYLLNLEQSYLDNIDWSYTYNKSKIANNGGGDTTGKSLLLLDTYGNLLLKFNSGLELARHFNKKVCPPANKGSIFNNKYRVVTPEFYSENKELILSWLPYKNPAKQLYLKNKEERIKKQNLKKQLQEYIKLQKQEKKELKIEYPQSKLPKKYTKEQIRINQRLVKNQKYIVL